MPENNKKDPSTDNGIKREPAKDIITKLLERDVQPGAVAEYFVEDSRYVLDIAREYDMSISEVYELAETDLWRLAVEACGYIGENITPIRRRAKMPPPEVPHTLSERYLLNNVFQEEGEIRFVTYDGFIDTQIKSVETYHIVLRDDTILKKYEILLAFPKDKMPYVKQGIKRIQEIAALNLRGIVKRDKRTHVPAKSRKGDLVECVMRNGLKIIGQNVWSSKYNLVLRVGGEKWKGGKIVLVYKHGLYEKGFKVLQSKPPRPLGGKDDFDEE